MQVKNKFSVLPNNDMNLFVHYAMSNYMIHDTRHDKNELMKPHIFWS